MTGLYAAETAPLQAENPARGIYSCFLSDILLFEISIAAFPVLLNTILGIPLPVL